MFAKKARACGVGGRDGGVAGIHGGFCKRAVNIFNGGGR